MRQYRHLLSQIAEECSISRGTLEPEASWKARIIYTACGRMMYAALWDGDAEQDYCVSIEHVRARTCGAYSSYMGLYPEMGSVFLDDSTVFFDEIYELYLSAGLFYHRSRKVRPAVRREACAGDVRFLRGIPLGESVCVSGLGAYRVDTSSNDKPNDVIGMFQLDEDTLAARWLKWTEWADWHFLEDAVNPEYLRMEEPFSEGYWQKRPISDGRISLLRWDVTGYKRYALYRVEGKKLLISRMLPSWCVERGAYRSVAAACLYHYGCLPAIRYQCDDDIVYVKQGYLLPPAELSFLKLYSWPKAYQQGGQDFERICSYEVFCAIQFILGAQGYIFEEE